MRTGFALVFARVSILPIHWRSSVRVPQTLGLGPILRLPISLGTARPEQRLDCLSLFDRAVNAKLGQRLADRPTVLAELFRPGLPAITGGYCLKKPRYNVARDDLLRRLPRPDRRRHVTVAQLDRYPLKPVRTVLRIIVCFGAIKPEIELRFRNVPLLSSSFVISYKV